eukprot:c20964_g1_i1.p1 GENE.c20964_g1_i1~~c20964_g1_i1.p1  ORF type:complete len:188 (-),score=3.35 c20964_g1_i1:12-575(-)
MLALTVGGRVFELLNATSSETSNPSPDHKADQTRAKADRSVRAPDHHEEGQPLQGQTSQTPSTTNSNKQHFNLASEHPNLLSSDKPRSRPKKFHCMEAGCGKSFRTNYDLQVHMCSHTGQRPFRCNFSGCEKAFAQAGGLVRHVRVHTGEKPYVCPFCAKRFSESCHRRRHAASRPQRSAQSSNSKS